MNAHTPGPWNAVNCSPNCSDMLLEVFDANSHNICSIHKNERGTQMTEKRANARLIAAAPELFNALNDVVNDLRGWCGVVARSRGAHSPEYFAACARLRKARAALAKVSA
jgi:hypothetical protein